MSPGPDPAALEALRGAIGAGSTLMPFAEAVLAQAGRPLGAAADPAREMHVAETLARLLAGDSEGMNIAGGAPSPSDASAVEPIRALLADPLLLSAFFQNIDLLYEAGSAEGDRVAAWVMAALEAISSPSVRSMHRRTRDRHGVPNGNDGKMTMPENRGPGRGTLKVLETCLYAIDLDAAAHFYEEVMGLEVQSRVTDRHVFFRCAGSVLLLFDPRRTNDPDADVPPHGATGPGHVAFAVDEDELGAWRDRLRKAGIPVEREVSWPGGGRSIYLRDPAGNSVELATPSIWGLAPISAG